jgi:F0F1-type ATP synthase membrane subunit b/b'
MATTTTSSGHEAAERLKAYADKVRAQINDAKARLQQFETTAKEKRAQAETAALNSLTAVKENIERKLHDLATTHESRVAQAKSDIEAEVAKFKSSVEKLSSMCTSTRK